MHKVREAMKSSGNTPMNEEVYVDEFVIGGKKEGKVGRSYHTNKKKTVCAVELTQEGKVKRMYSMRIDNYSAKELRKLFDSHISTTADVITDKRKGYRPLMNEYNITQEEINGVKHFTR